MLRACPIFRVTLLFTVLPICANALTNTASNLDVGTGESLTLNGVHFYTEEVNIHNGGVVYVKSHDGTGNTGQLVLVAPVISISAGSLIDGDSAGYPAAQGPGQGSGGTGDGNDGSGGGYGGMGGLGNLGGYPPGVTYGAQHSADIEMGSGGGGANGDAGSGGGAVTLICGSLHLNGTVRVNGEIPSRWGGGGAGGGILILAQSLSGTTGSLSANGGTALAASGGGGGGGRIKSCVGLGEIALEVVGGGHNQPNATDGEPGTTSEFINFADFSAFSGFGEYFELSDFDGDGTPDALEDFDGDGIPDAFEDFDGNGTPDAFEDFDENGTPDSFEDFDGNGIPEAFEDFNNDGKPDAFAADFNGNLVPDAFEDFYGTDVPDFFEADFNANGKPDVFEFGWLKWVITDFNGNGMPDAFDDFDGDGTPDAFDDFDGNGIPEAFEDFNNDGKPDAFDADFNGNLVPDAFEDFYGTDVPDFFEIDSNGNGKPDVFEFGWLKWVITDFNGNGMPDAFDDFDGDGTPDAFEDFNGNGVPDAFEDFNGNGSPDAFEDIDASRIPDAFEDFDGNGTPDAFEDLNQNDTPDAFEDTDGNLVPDGFEDDNGNLIWDFFEDRYALVSESHPSPGHWFTDSTFLCAWENYYPEASGYLFLFDHNETIAVTLVNGEWTTDSSLARGPFSHGTWYFHIAAVDAGGSLIEGSQRHFQFNVNQLPPSITSSTHPDPNQWYPGGNISLSWTNEDVTVGSMARHYFILDESENTIPDTGSESTVSQTKNFFGKPDGTYYFHIVSEDGLGNLTEAGHFRVNIGEESPATPTSTLSPTETNTPSESPTETLTSTPSGTPSPTPSFAPTATPVTPIGIEMIPIPAGSFQMGNTGTSRDQDCQCTGCDCEEPRHLVAIDYSFQMGKYEVTNAQYAEVLNWVLANRDYLSEYAGGDVYYNSSILLAIGPDCDIEYDGSAFYVETRDSEAQENHPVVGVSWYGAVAFCNWLSEKQGLEPCYDLATWTQTNLQGGGYRLPSESEWEYSCRGPESNPSRYEPFAFGDDPSYSMSSCAENPLFAPYMVWCGSNDGWTEEVGARLPVNGWGLHNMHGNATEWCQDAWAASYDGVDYPVDGTPYENVASTARAKRGGNWNNYAKHCRTAYRNDGGMGHIYNSVGFRLSIGGTTLPTNTQTPTPAPTETNTPSPTPTETRTSTTTPTQKRTNTPTQHPTNTPTSVSGLRLEIDLDRNTPDVDRIVTIASGGTIQGRIVLDGHSAGISSFAYALTVTVAGDMGGGFDPATSSLSAGDWEGSVGGEIISPDGDHFFRSTFSASPTGATEAQITVYNFDLATSCTYGEVLSFEFKPTSENAQLGLTLDSMIYSIQDGFNPVSAIGATVNCSAAGETPTPFPPTPTPAYTDTATSTPSVVLYPDRPDLYANGWIDVIDLFAFCRYWMQNDPQSRAFVPGDFDGDGSTGFEDLIALVEAWHTFGVPLRTQSVHVALPATAPLDLDDVLVLGPSNAVKPDISGTGIVHLPENSVVPIALTDEVSGKVVFFSLATQFVPLDSAVYGKDTSHETVTLDCLSTATALIYQQIPVPIMHSEAAFWMLEAIETEPETISLAIAIEDVVTNHGYLNYDQISEPVAEAAMSVFTRFLSGGAKKTTTANLPKDTASVVIQREKHRYLGDGQWSISITFRNTLGTYFSVEAYVEGETENLPDTKFDTLFWPAVEPAIPHLVPEDFSDIKNWFSRLVNAFVEGDVSEFVASDTEITLHRDDSRTTHIVLRLNSGRAQTLNALHMVLSALGNVSFSGLSYEQVGTIAQKILTPELLRTFEEATVNADYDSIVETVSQLLCDSWWRQDILSVLNRDYTDAMEQIDCGARAITGIVNGAASYLYSFGSVMYNAFTGTYDTLDFLLDISQLPPAPPTGVSASTGNVAGSIDLRWDKVDEATGYRIYYDEGSDNPPYGPTDDGNPASGSDVGDVDHVMIGDLAPDTVYHLAAKSYNDVGESENYSGQVSARAGIEANLQSPSTVSASDGSYQDKIRVTWSSVSNADGYFVYRAATPNGSYGEIHDTGSAAVTSYDDVLDCGGPFYYYKIKAYRNEGGASGFSIYDRGHTADCPAPQPPSTLNASDGSYQDKIRVTWSSVNNVDGYKVFRAATPDASYGEIHDTGSAAVTSYDDVLPCGGPYYYYKIKAYRTQGGTSGFSNYDRAHTADCPTPEPPPPPTGVVATTGSTSGSVDISWLPVADADGYRIYYDEDGNPPYQPSIIGDPPSSVDLGNVTQVSVTLIPDTVYYFALKSYNATGQSVEYSIVASAHTASSSGIPISSIKELQKIGKEPTYPRWEEYFLTQDIDASPTDYWNGGMGFEPLCGALDPFIGTFDGRGKAIVGLVIDRPDDWPAGLFVRAKGATLKNLKLLRVSVRGDDMVGGLVGSGYDGTRITECLVTGSVNGLRGGGLVGWMGSDCTVSGCQSDCVVTGGVVGGLVGTIDAGFVRHSISSGATVGTGSAGGLAGIVGTGGVVEECYSTGRVSSDSYISGDLHVGGLIGWLHNGSVHDCFSWGAVSGEVDVGGLVGFNWGGEVLRCYATGRVEGGLRMGGLVGITRDGTVSKSYWDIEAAGIGTSHGSDSSYGKTTAEMKRSTTFSDWNFVTTWDTVEDITYPWLHSIQRPDTITFTMRDGIIGTIATGSTISLQAGDDGYYQYGRPHSYTDNGDGTVTDNNTGLMWVKDPRAAGVGDVYTWSQGLSTCDHLEYAGHSDWRLPTACELETLRDAGRFRPAIGSVFVCEATEYWSSTVGLRTPETAWSVHFGYGGVNASGQTWRWHIRPVRISASPEGDRFIDHHDGTVTDNHTRLMWVKDPSAAGIGDVYNWSDAVATCEGLSYADYSDWRLPSINELSSLVDRDRLQPAMNSVFAGGWSGSSSYAYWSSTVYALTTMYCCYVDFRIGVVWRMNRPVEFFVRPVRGTPRTD